MSTSNRKFVWFDLMSSDVEGAKGFYAELFGWKAHPMASGGYDVWAAGEARLGGVLTTERGAPSYWLGYVATQDLDGTIQRTEWMKGRVVVPATAIPDFGRYAVLSDPQGASFGVSASRHERHALDRMALGQVGWSELNATDWKTAWQFYSELFGWKHVSSVQMEEGFGEYFMFGTDSKEMIGGMSSMAAVMKSWPSWLHYVNVKSVDESARRVSQLGGKVVNGPIDVPGGSRIAVCADPQGASFGLLTQ